MAAIASGDEARFAQVSSLYGPGTVTGWCFTILSVLVSCILHLRKRKSGSIDVNLIAVLTLPAVAAGHVIWQRQKLSNHMVDIDEEALIQSIATIEAPFIATETFMAASIILFLVAAWAHCIRRAIFVALIGLECFIVESYVHFHSYSFQHRPHTLTNNFPAFSRPFVADFTGLLIALIVLSGFLIVLTGLVAILILFRSREGPPSPEQAIERSSQPHESLDVEDDVRSSTTVAQVDLSAGQLSPSGMKRQWRIWSLVEESQLRSYVQASRRSMLVYFIFLPIAFITSAGPSSWHLLSYSVPPSNETSLWHRTQNFAARFVRHFFPRTPCSITDLDQAVAAVAGAMALAFSIYSVSKAYYKTWSADEISSDTGLSRRGSDTGLSRRGSDVFELRSLEHQTRPRRGR